MRKLVAWVVILLGSFVIASDQGWLDSVNVPIVAKPTLGTLVIIEQAEDREPVIAELVRSDYVDKLPRFAILDADSEEARDKYGDTIAGLDLPVGIVFDDEDRFAGKFSVGDSLEELIQQVEGIANAN